MLAVNITSYIYVVGLQDSFYQQFRKILAKKIRTNQTSKKKTFLKINN